MCANRLGGEKSPYLRQHAHNPVDWHPWGAEAFAEARRRDVSVFLSIGYSTCHWCHVMERESFEREDVAQALREGFVAIKVDREERPDLDDLYMTATQLMTGRGGWPNSLWLTPDGRPWYAGTYFPAEDRQGMAGFKTVLHVLAQAWRERRAAVERQAELMAEALRAQRGEGRAEGPPMREWAARVAGELRGEFDAVHGGFGGAPKFPPHAALRLLLEEARRGEEGGAMRMARGTLDAMALGGIRDHLGGGFHRYATDAEWFLPHFEKMLYDNALLIRAYALAFTLTGRRLYRAAAAEACEWVLREMTHPEGGFYSALDADSEGEEGRCYLWRRDEVLAALGPGAGEEFCRVYGVTEEGNYRAEHGGGEGGRNILFRREAGDGAEALAEAAQRLATRRAARVRPHCDDKVLADWNGLMIGALAFAGEALGEGQYTRAAARGAEFVLARLRPAGRLLHRWREGEARGGPFLEDYACMGEGLLDLASATGGERWVAEARALADEMLELFGDPAGGALFQSARDGETLVARMKQRHDAAMPSGNGMAARFLARLAEGTGEGRYLAAAEGVLSGLAETLRQAPQLACTAAEAAGWVGRLRARMEGAEAARLEFPGGPVRAGEDVEMALRLVLKEGIHIAMPPGGAAQALPVEVNAPEDVEVLGVERPEAGWVEVGGVGQRAYCGVVTLRVRLRVAAEAAVGERRVRFSMALRPCTERECLAEVVARGEGGVRVR